MFDKPFRTQLSSSLLSRVFYKRLDTLDVKTHAVFQSLLENYEPDTFCPEPGHPNLTGHLVIDDAVLKALTQK